MANFDP